VNQAHERGKADAKRDKAPIFRETRHGIEATSDDGMDETMSESWSQEDRFHYLQGYNHG
jgi:hypothetical protein